MQSRFTKKAQEALDHASEAAVMLGHSYIGLIQTEECLASAVLAEYDVTDEKIINLVYQLIAPEGAVGVKEPTGYTPRVRRILENSAKEAIRFKADLIGTEHILISIIKESECVAARLLNTIGVNYMLISLLQWEKMLTATRKIFTAKQRKEKLLHRHLTSTAGI